MVVPQQVGGNVFVVITESLSNGMDKITASMRICLIGRAEDLQHLLDVGIEDVDWYRNAWECSCLLNSIDESERTPEEISQSKRLRELTDKYEEEHYRYGN